MQFYETLSVIYKLEDSNFVLTEFKTPEAFLEFEDIHSKISQKSIVLYDEEFSQKVKEYSKKSFLEILKIFEESLYLKESSYIKKMR